jgi:hypothetical protein
VSPRYFVKYYFITLLPWWEGVGGREKNLQPFVNNPAMIH